MASNRIDINTATVEDFEQLLGVGHFKAESIVKHRKAVGGFKLVGDLSAVPGVGQSVIDLNRRHIFCGPIKRQTRLSGGCVDRLAKSSASRGEPTAGTSRPGPSVRLRRSSETLHTIKPLQVSRRQRQTSGHAKPDLHRRVKDTKLGSVRERKSKDVNSTNEDSSSVLPSTSRLSDVASSSNDGGKNSSSAGNSVKCVTVTVREEGGNVVRVGEEDEDQDEEGENEDRDTDSSDDDLEDETGRGDSGREGSGRDDSGRERMEAESGEDGGDDESEMSVSDSGCGGVSRSRIPVPILGHSSSSLGKHMMKRKSHSEDLLLPSGKRICRTESASPQTTYGNLKGPLRRNVHLPRQRIPSKEHPPAGLTEWLKQFQEWGNAERLMAVDHLITLCEPTQVRHMMQLIEPQFQRDFISLLPKELALYTLSFLEPKDLLQAAQTCRYWRVLTEDNLLWREKCREENIDESLVFGSNRLRRRQPSPKSPWKGLYMRQHQIEQNWRHGQLRPPKLLKGHDDHVITCLEFCGNRVVSGSDDNTLKVWSAVTGKCLRTLVGHTGGVWSSQMQGTTIISGSTDRTLKVWNADTGQCIYTLYGHTSTVRCMHLHESKVVSGSRDATLRVWNIETGTCLHVLMGHVAAVRCVQYDGRRVVSGAYDYLVKVWDPETETCLHTLAGHTNRVYSLQFDSVHIVSGSLDTSIRVWDVETGNCLHTLMGHQSLTSGLELKDNILVSGNADSTVKVWDITTGQCLQTLQGSNKHQSAVTCLQFNKIFVITSSDDGTVKIWDLKSGDFLRNLVTLESGGSGGVVWRVRCSNTKLVCAVGSRNGTEETKLLVLDFDVEDKKEKEKLPMIERA